MVSLRYRGKFNAALYALAVREGDVRARLRCAYRELRSLREDEVPVRLRTEWHAVLKELTRRGPSYFSTGEVHQSAIDHTLNRMRNKTGRRIAVKIYALVRSVE